MSGRRTVSLAVSFQPTGGDRAIHLHVRHVGPHAVALSCQTRHTVVLKAKHTAIREATAALLPATLERVFTGSQ